MHQCISKLHVKSSIKTWFFCSNNGFSSCTELNCLKLFFFLPFPLQSSLITAIVNLHWKMSDHKLQKKKKNLFRGQTSTSVRDENVYSNYPRLRHDFNRLRKSLKTTTELRVHVWSDYFSFRQNAKEIITQLLLISYCFTHRWTSQKNIGFQDTATRVTPI